MNLPTLGDVFGTTPKRTVTVAVYETCRCGAVFKAEGLHSWVSHDAQQFRAAHRPCRTQQVGEGEGKP